MVFTKLSNCVFWQNDGTSEEDLELKEITEMSLYLIHHMSMEWWITAPGKVHCNEESDLER